jgi:hypothetical protein
MRRAFLLKFICNQNMNQEYLFFYCLNCTLNIFQFCQQFLQDFFCITKQHRSFWLKK